MQPEYIDIEKNKIKKFSEEEKTGLIHDLLEQNKELYQQLIKDTLTGLYNRETYYKNIKENVERAKRGRPFTLLNIDLDNFKQINDNYGHKKGDELLSKVAQNLEETTREYDKVYRIGGDEFSVQLEDVYDEEREHIARVYFEGKKGLEEYNAGMSIGGVSYKGCDWLDTEKTVETMIEQADQLMYKVKDTCNGFLLKEFEDILVEQVVFDEQN